MVNERAPPSKSLANRLAASDSAGPAKAKAADDDDDISAIVNGWASIKSSDRAASTPPFPQARAVRQFGHPTKLVSSRKQKADVFIRQTTRPEHHITSTKVHAPKAQTYTDRKPPPPPVFNSNQAERPARGKFGEEVFYTDPAKASADLKALLEGGMEDEAEEDDQQEPAIAEGASDGKKPENTKKNKSKQRVSKDGKIDGLKVRLLPHQVEGVEWMLGRELGPVKRGTVPKGGLLADDMGLGKTLQTVSLILSNLKPEKGSDAWKPQYEKMEKTTLVVAPLALIRQWEHEINDKVEKATGLKVHVHHGPQRTKNFKDLTRYNVVITTYQILVSDHGNSSETEDGKKTGCFGPTWWRVVLDEAHTIKNRNAKTTKACYALRSEYRWCLTGTPMQNNLDELQSLIRFLRIKPYDELRQWRDHIDQPLKNGKGHVAIGRLHSVLQCFMKRRTKDILKEEGALKPGGKSAEGEEDDPGPGFKHTERKVVTVSAELSAAERQFYNRLEDRTGESMKRMMEEKLNYLNAFTLLLRLRQACNHPKLVEGKIERDRDAITTDSSQSQNQKSQESEMDAMADLFSGMGLDSKKCGVCSMELSKDDAAQGLNTCSSCKEDMVQFKEFEKSNKKKKMGKHKTKSKSKSSKSSKIRQAERKQEITTGKMARRPRNRNTVLDSDDEDDVEGSWLVSDGERGPLNLGKAGGEEDENAAGPTEWLRSESEESEESEDEDQSNLSSFVVDDENEAKPSQDNNDSLLSIDALTRQLESQTLEDKPTAASQASATEVEDEDDDSSEGKSSSSVSGIDESELYSDDDDVRPAPGSSQIVASAKIRELSRILHAEAHEHKFIVFSQFTSMLDLVEPFIRKDGYKFTRYDGSMRNDEREESLRQLREDKRCRVLLCSLKCGSLGLNLTAATRVVIIEPFWNPFVEEQAIDRVHRLNQTVDVVVYKLTVANTVEERIVDLQEKKRLLAEQAIDMGAKKGALKLGLNEIIDMFKPGGHFSNGTGARGVREQVQAASRLVVDGSSGRRAPPKREESSIYGRRW
ncbi:SNF2 family helicase/ATPase [Cordyceps fumosorosea ARSEF 2679]|uniref:SNF2 family helicase/ATPase n=1 Tax=Cordyceps fumosorosea (strain ARSEF 2679) TaxID=1081104 RepID=A0A162JL02_CORFA|nr:SNF2 family helicase/ATPase [Cordyceps fumosorosea ARSEF 2679]OAA70522.1 SNF2 family helicase/ATPase [Cordyceps fumosorosea ARSEF 2679]